ncbi:MAG: hypothetical protein HKN13_08955 [Rhodothermales bacterium]|nr:hypothetical protein [Rhodothermales bacterium]
MSYFQSISVISLVFLQIWFAGSCTRNGLERTPVRHATGYGESSSAMDSLDLYDLAAPAWVFDLPKRLNEISGMTIVGDSLLHVVQDERGRIYSINASTGKVVSDAKFGSSGDYEAIEAANDSLYVLRSNGDLFVVPLADPGTRAKRIKTRLSASDDTEGLAFDVESGSLLIAQKESRSDARAVFRYDFQERTISESPVVSVSTKAIEQFISRRAPKGRRYKPSGIAINPIDRNYYIVSSSWRLLVVVDRNGSLVQVAELSDKRIRQPEGIAFGSTGKLYLSSEARGKTARIFVYNPLI